MGVWLTFQPLSRNRSEHAHHFPLEKGTLDSKLQEISVVFALGNHEHGAGFANRVRKTLPTKRFDGVAARLHKLLVGSVQRASPYEAVHQTTLSVLRKPLHKELHEIRPRRDVDQSIGLVHVRNDRVLFVTLFGANRADPGFDGDVVSLARPYVTRGLGNDTLHFGVERHKVSISSMLSRAVVVYEGSVVNRVIID